MAIRLSKRNLSDYDTEAFLDISPSMGKKDTPSGLSRLDDSKKVVSVLIQEVGAIDTDGITFCTFDSKLQAVYENTTDAKAQAVLSKACANGDGTCHASALKPRVDDYLNKLLGKPKSGFLGRAVPADPNTKPRIFLVITDGEPTSFGGARALEDLIIGATKRLAAAGYGREKVGFSFIQTGRDKGATDFLNTLNNGLVAKGAAFDCVNCLTVDECAGLSTIEILEKALDD